MAPVNIKHIVSFSSQDPDNGVDNLCTVTDSPKPWLCSAQDRSGVLKAELQMERATLIGYIDVGNCGSAFIQIDVGSSSWSLDQPYVTLLPTATLMSPADSRQGKGRTGVRMFKKADFLPAGADGSWDRVRVTCTQLFNRRVQFGLSFLHIRSPHAECEGGAEEQSGDQEAPEGRASKLTEWLSSPAVQRAFFVQMNGEKVPEADLLSVAPEGVRGAGLGLRRTARMVTTAARSARCLLSAPLLQHNQSRDTDAAEKEADVSSMPSEKKTCRRVKRELNPKIRSVGGRGSTARKRSGAAAHTRSLSSGKGRCRSPPSPHTEPLDWSSPETTCPLCGGHFSSEYLPMHASSCQGREEQPVYWEALMGGSSPYLSPSPGSLPSPREELVPCPLCSFRFPLDEIQQHASTCGEPEWVWVH